MSRSQPMIVFTGLILFASAALSDYVRTGPLFGEDCKGFVVEVCPEYELVAVKSDGQLFDLATVVSNRGVDEYSERRGMCWKTLRSEGAGLLSRAINMVALQTYIYVDENGRHKEVKPDRLKFQCYKR
jgi:hypothetical protein